MVLEPSLDEDDASQLHPESAEINILSEQLDSIQAERLVTTQCRMSHNLGFLCVHVGCVSY